MDDGRGVAHLVVYESSTGEVLCRACAVDPSTGSRARQQKTIRAFVRDVCEKGGKVGFWTFGSNLLVDVENVDEFCDWSSRLARWLPGRWVLVIESGSKGGRIHAHVLMEEYVAQKEAREEWARITGIVAPHVYTEVLREVGLSGGAVDVYLSKRLGRYLRKSAASEAWTGRRLFRSSKGLVRSLAEVSKKIRDEEGVPRMFVELTSKGG